jgi:metal-responsive CopG/Arc/MetJ family transcriptional regulator
MGRARKIAITVESSLLDRAERLRRTTDESRSAVFARALRALLKEEDRRRNVAEYVLGYKRLPETRANVKDLDAVSVEGLSDLPWDDE